MEQGVLLRLVEDLLTLTDPSRAAGQSVPSVIRTLLSYAQSDGPLRMIGGTPTPCDLGVFHQHLTQLSQVINTLHDQKVLGEYLQSPSFPRAKYELFALQHMQLLVWLQRVQTSSRAAWPSRSRRRSPSSGRSRTRRACCSSSR